MSVLARAWGRMRPGGEHPTQLEQTPGPAAPQRIADVRMREIASVRAVVSTTVASPQRATAMFTARLDDGTGRLDVVWLGRRAIGAVVPGTELLVTGRVCDRGGIATIYNPSYEIQVPRAR